MKNKYSPNPANDALNPVRLCISIVPPKGSERIFTTKKYELIIIGGGPAGMAAALAARQKNIRDILIIERDVELGGILNQCIHNGFGLHYFKEELTGPEYSSRIAKEIESNGIDYLINTMVINIEPDKTVHAINPKDGYLKIPSRAIVLAMGCRERTRGAINICGDRPAGIFTAGTAQRLINMDGYLPGKNIVILGSGDIGLIMARRMTQEGAKVHAVLEIMPYSNGLNRNIVQCLDDYNIPLFLQHTILKIHGKDRINGVTIAAVDAMLKPILGTEKYIACDTLLLSVGLIPENEISKKLGVKLDPRTSGPIVGESRQTSVDGVFACGNVLQVHDLVDFVSAEGKIAGEGAAKYLHQDLNIGMTHLLKPSAELGYIIPQHIHYNNIDEKFQVYTRVKNIIENKKITAYLGNKLIASKKEPKFLPAEMITFSIDKKDLDLPKSTETPKEIIIKIE